MPDADKTVEVLKHDNRDPKYSDGSIWKELKPILHERGSGPKLGQPGGHISDKSRCDPSKPSPLCRVQDRLFQKDMFGRATRLQVAPTGNKWFYVTLLVFMTVAVAAFLLIYFKNLVRGSYGFGISQRIRESMTPISGFVVLFFAWLILIAVVQVSKTFEYKVYIPVPEKEEGKLEWGYYLSTALPLSDVELITAEGSKKKGKIAAQAVAPYQGALNINQLKVKMKSALTDLVSKFAPKSASSRPSPAVDTKVLMNAAKEIYASRNAMKQFNDIADKNGITIESLTEISVSTNDVYKYPEVGPIASETLKYADKAELPEKGPAPDDDHWRSDVKVLLSVENPKLKAATERYTSAVSSMMGLGPRLQPTATKLGYLSDDRLGTAVNEAMSKVVVDTSEDFTRITSAAKSMIDKDVVKVDSLVGFSAAVLDDLLVPYTSKQAEFNEVVWKRVISCVAILSAMWLVWYLIGAFKHPSLKTLGEQLNNIGTTKVSYKNSEGKVVLLPEAERTYQRAKTYNNGMAFVASLLTSVLKWVVLAMVITAVCITYYNRSMRWSVALREEQDMLEIITSALRKMDKLGCIALLNNGSPEQLAYVEGIKQIEESLNMNILSDGDASATGQYPIAEMVTYVVMAAFAAAVILILAKRMMPQETYSHMQDLHARAQVGGGSEPMSVDQSAYLDSLIGDGIPSDLRATIILISLISICYYFVTMIKDTAMYKERLSSVSIVERMQKIRAKVA